MYDVFRVRLCDPKDALLFRQGGGSVRVCVCVATYRLYHVLVVGTNGVCTGYE